MARCGLQRWKNPVGDLLPSRRGGERVAFSLRNLIPRDEKFYDAFVALAEEIKSGAALLVAMLAPEHPIWDKADEIKEIEHKCDFLAHEIIDRLNKTFVTPLDREDIHTLATTLDDVMDAIDASAWMIRLYQIEHIRPGTRELAHIVLTSVEQVVLAMRAFEHRKGITERAIEINRLENEADRAHQAAVRRLFEDERDPVQIMKWKEILDFLEEATDRCEDVANVLEGVVVKHA
jgi:predicted phosphate transport protein (TIGR00153 family)